MRFRPCIDIHNGKVKQIVGGSLMDKGECVSENFVSSYDAAYYGKLYQEKGLYGGHVIALNGADSDYYDADCQEMVRALNSFPGGFQAGGGITDRSAGYFIEQGASHVIVTSFVFCGGQIHWERLKSLVNAVGKEHVVLDVSCRRKDGRYYIVTDRWQTFTDVCLDLETLKGLETFCDEFLVHGVDMEGKCQGVEKDLLKILGSYHGQPITYAGGISSFEDLDCVQKFGGGRVDATIGSALDLFGGNMEFDKVIEYCENHGG